MLPLKSAALCVTLTGIFFSSDLHLWFICLPICHFACGKRGEDLWQATSMAHKKNTRTIDRLLRPSTEETELTVRQDSICPERIFSPSRTMSPAITALVVAIAGIIFPAMAETSRSTSEPRLWKCTWKKWTLRYKLPAQPGRQLTLDIKATLHVHAKDVHS